MKTSKDFRLSKSTKRVLATLPTSVRGHWKSMMKLKYPKNVPSWPN